MRDSKYCSGCNKIHPIDRFSIRATGPRIGQPVSKCKSCLTEMAKGNRRKRIARGVNVYEDIEWPSKLRRIYGIEPEDYYRMIREQGGGCAICGSITSGYRGKKKLAVDHCHSTGFVRGILCMKCNKALGLFNDNIEVILRAASYLAKFK